MGFIVTGEANPVRWSLRDASDNHVQLRPVTESQSPEHVFFVVHPLSCPPVDDDRTYRLNRRRNPATRINMRDVVIARDDRRTERDLPSVDPPSTEPRVAPRASHFDDAESTRETQPLPFSSRSLAQRAARAPRPGTTDDDGARRPWADPRDAIEARRPLAEQPPRYPRGTAQTIERRLFGGVEVTIEHRGDAVTLIVPGAPPLTGSRTETIDLIAGLLGRG